MSFSLPSVSLILVAGELSGTAGYNCACIMLRVAIIGSSTSEVHVFGMFSDTALSVSSLYQWSFVNLSDVNFYQTCRMFCQELMVC